MKTEILKKIIAEWLEEKVFPPLVKRDAPDLVLDRVLVAFHQVTGKA